MKTKLTSSQTVGPFFAPLLRGDLSQMVSAETRGERVVIEGRVLDGNGDPVPDAMIEIWQANAEGRYDHPEDMQEKRLDPAFHGFGRVGTNARGEFTIHTIVPGAVPAQSAQSQAIWQAPHLNLIVFARGLLTRLVTRIYFPGEIANDSDPVLCAVPAGRRATLIAKDIERLAADKAASRRLCFDIVLQGANETVFFDV